MRDKSNPLGREYSTAEWAAAKRLGIARDQKADNGGKIRTGALIWGTGSYHPNNAHQKARDWALVSAAIDREWTKKLEDK